MKRKTYKLPSSAKKGLFALALTVFSGTAHSQTTYTFSYTGSTQTISLPAGNYSIQCWGADGGDATNGSAPMSGGAGGYSRGVYTNTATAVFNVYVGGHGGNASGAADLGAGGGGMSDIAAASNTAVVIIAAGGGGGATSGGGSEASTGGGGGGLTGGTAIDGSGVSTGTAASGGSQTAGGIAQAGSYGVGTPGGYGYGGGAANGGSAGVMHSAGGTGGNGGTGGWNGGGGGCTLTGGNDHSGGGGAGYYGGGGGRADGGAGGGGSSYIGGVTSGTTFMLGQTGFVSNPDVTGNGRILITELCSIDLYASGTTNSLSPSICSGQSFTLMTNAISNYSWNTGATTSSLVVSPATNTVYTLTATSPSNCTSSKSISVTVSSGSPVLSISNPSNNICLGKAITLTASGALSYTWTNPGVVNGQTFTPSSTAVYTVSGENGCGIVTATTTVTVAPLAVAASVSPTLACQNQPATLSATASVTGFTWQPFAIQGSSVTILPTSNVIFTVTASDGTCSGTQTVSVLTKPTPTLSISTTNSVICDGDVITLSVTGASAYTWTPGNFSGNTVTVSPSTTTIYVADGSNTVGCSSSAQQIILVNYGPTLAVTANQTIVCTGDPIVLTASGASGYNWTNGPATPAYTVNPTGPAIYTVTGSHSANVCTTTGTIEVDAIVPAVIAPTNTSVCAGSTVTLVSGGATTYSWNGFSSGPLYVVQPASTNIYTLVANTQSGQVSCPVTFTAMVTVNPLPTITVVPTRPQMCKFETNTLTASGGVQYDWGSASTATGSSVTLTLSATSVFTIMGTDANGCSKVQSYQVSVSNCTGLSERTTSKVVSVFPNPNNGEFVIAGEIGMEISLLTVTGQLVQTIKLEKLNNYKVNISNLPSGVYFVTGRQGENTINQKIIVSE
jgi:hypothetical protein